MRQIFDNLNLIPRAIFQPGRLAWWEWCSIFGLVAPATLLYFGLWHPLLWAIALHFLLDFCGQSSETAGRKAEKDLWTLVYHSFISGGYPGLLVGGLEGLFISWFVHFCVDATGKFGLPGLKGAAADQLSHLLTIVIIYYVTLG